MHGKGLCPIVGQQCHKRKRLNYFARMCRAPGGRKNQVNIVHDCDSDTESMFIGAVNSGDQDWVETVDFGNVKEVFKLDTGAQCNFLPKTCVRQNHNYAIAAIISKTRKLFEDLHKTSRKM